MNRLITFSSVHQAIKAERVLCSAGVVAKFRPTPRELSVSCGQSVLFDSVDEKAVIELFSERAVIWNNLFEMTEVEGENTYARIGSYTDY